MKKLMIAVAAVACATVGLADDITSNNIVGYMGNPTGTKTRPMYGFTFTPVDGKDYILLGSVKASGMDPYQDIVQVIHPETLAATKSYCYYSDAQAQADAWEVCGGDPTKYQEAYDEYKQYIGWWNEGVGNEPADEDHITVGSGFLGYSPDKNDITFTCNGEAPTTTKAYAPGKATRPIIANFLPTDSCLKDILVSGMDPYQDIVQVLNPEEVSVATKAYCYYSDLNAQNDAWEVCGGDPTKYQEAYDEYKQYIGWWNEGVGNEAADDDPVDAAAGFLVYSPDQNEMTFNFKSVLDVTKPTK